jgi:hypothetical protein
MEQDDEVSGSAVEDSVELASVMAPEFAELAFDLRAVREGEIRMLVTQFVQEFDRKGD